MSIRILWLCAAAIAASTGASVQLHFEPAIAAARSLGASYSARAEANDELLRDAAIEQKRQRLAEAELRRLAGGGTEPPAAQVIALAGASALRNRVQIAALEPLPAAPAASVESAFHATAFQLRLRGHFASLVPFIAALSHGKVPVSVDAVQMRANGAGPSPAIDADVDIRLYRLERGV